MHPDTLSVLETFESEGLTLSQRYRQEASLPRRTDKAKIYFIPSGTFPIFQEEDWEDLPDIEQEHDKVLSYLRQQDPDIRRGDIIVIEEQLDENNRGDIGKFAFDDEKIISWNSDPESPGARFLPEEFQVITEFPIHYWSEAFDDSSEMHVPFDFRQNIAQPEIYPFPGTSMLALSFRDKYHILGEEYGTDGLFIEEIKNLKYFSVTNYPFHNLDTNHLLIAPNVYTPR